MYQQESRLFAFRSRVEIFNNSTVAIEAVHLSRVNCIVRPIKRSDTMSTITHQTASSVKRLRYERSAYKQSYISSCINTVHFSRRILISSLPTQQKKIV